MLEPRGMITLLLPNVTLGKRISRLRKEHKLTQVELAAIAGVYPRYLSDVETDRRDPGIKLIAQLAMAFGVTIDELAGIR